MCQNELWEQSMGMPILHRWANHQECTGLPCGKKGKRDKDYPLVPLSGGSCDLWCPGWNSKDVAERQEQGPADTSRPGQQSGISICVIHS